MKKLIILSVASLSLFASCTQNNSNKTCDYNSVTIKAFEMETDKLLDEKYISNCFNIEKVKGAGGLIEVKDDSSKIKISYYNEKDPNVIKFLNVRFGESDPIEWRANKGHDLFIIKKSNSLGFIFGDKKSKIKGTIDFKK